MSVNWGSIPLKSVTRDKQKVQLNKWVGREIKTHNRKRSNSRITTSPKFTYNVDNKSKEGKIILCYSIPKPEPSAKKGWRLKQKQLYKKNSNISNYKETLRVFDDFEYVKSENELAYDSLNIDENALRYWIDKYSSGDSRWGVKIPSERTVLNDKWALDTYHNWLKDNKPKHLNIWTHTRDGREVLMEMLSEYRNSGTWKDSTVNNMYRTCRSFFNFIHVKEHTTTSPISLIH